MTTANLSVGIKTQKAKEAMQALLADLKTSMKGVKFEIDTKSIKDALQDAAKVKLTVHADTDALKKSISSALDDVFRRQYSIVINTSALTEQVRGAVQAGMTGVTLKSTGGGAVAPVPGSVIAAPNDNNKLIIQIGQAFSDAVGNQVNKAAQQLQGAMSKGPLQASARFSAVDPETGARFSATQRLGDPQAALDAIQRQNSGVEALRMRTEAENRRAAQAAVEARKQAEIDASWKLRAKPLDKDAAWAAAEAARGTQIEEGKAKLGVEALKARIKERVALEKQAESEISRFFDAEQTIRTRRQEAALKAQNQAAQRLAEVRATQAAEAARKQSDIEAAWRGQTKVVDKDAAWAAAEAARGTELAKSRASLDIELAKQKARERLALERQTESHITNYFAAEQAQRTRLQEAALRAQAANQAKAAQAAWQFGPDRSAMLSMRDQANEEAKREQERALRSRMQNTYSSAKFAAADNYTARGAQIAGAKALTDEFGPDAAGKFLNNSGLIGMIPMLENHRKKVKESGEEVSNHTKKVKANTDAHAAWRNAMNDVHSGARGLAGSLGMLWTTWGNTVPIVAMAALGATMRSVFMVGKDLEYQMTFVSALTDNSVVSMEKFGNAVRMGAMVAPVEAAQAMRGLAQNGLSVRDSLQALPTILQLATVGEMSLADAALGATGVMAAFNLQVSDLPRIVDVFAKAAAMSNTSVSQMTEAMKQASTVSDQYGVSLEDTAATLATMAKRNITGSAAGTAFRNMMVELATPTEKAKKAFASLNVELYNKQGQLKEYGDLLLELKNKTALLNDQSRLNFLNDVFGERGGKAINSLLSDYKLFQETQRQLKEESKDFAASVSSALESTTQGKLKAMMSEFQLTTSDAFSSASKEVNHFIDTLRGVFASNEFKEGIISVSKALTDFTNFLAENGRMVITTIELWAGFRILGSVAAGLYSAGTALGVVTAASSTAAVAMRVFWGAATGGLAIIAALGLEFLNYKNNTTEAEEAQRRFGTELDLINNKLGRELEALRESNKALDRRNDLMLQGKTRAEADKIIESETSQKKSTSMAAEAAQAKKLLDDAKAARQKLVDEQNDAYSMTSSMGAMPMNQGQIEILDRQIKTYTENLEKVTEAKRKFDAQVFEKGQSAWKTDRDRRLGEMEAFNQRLSEVDDQRKGIKTSDLRLEPFQVLFGDQKTFDALMKDVKGKLSSRLGTYAKPNPELRHEESTTVRDMLSQMNREREELQLKLDLQAKLERAEFPERVIGAETAAYMAEQRAISGVIKLKELEQEWNKKITDTIAGSKNLSKSDRAQLTEALARNNLSITKAEYRAQQEGLVLKRGLLNQENKIADERKSTLEKLRDKVIQSEREMDVARAKKFEDPESAARQAAIAKVTSEYESDIRRAMEDVEATQRSLNTLKERAKGLEGQAKADAEDIVALEEKKLTSAQGYLDTLRKQRDSDAERLGNKAVSNFQYETSAEGGWDRYWAEYKKQGVASSELVYQALKSSTDRMKGALDNFVMTGKLNFKSLIVSWVQDMAKLSANSLFSKLLNLGFNMVTGNSGAGTITGGNGLSLGGTGGSGSGFGSFGPVKLGGSFANGGIMTAFGPLALRKYENGGVANSPQLALYGEGRKPEAYVPLPDGRSIPVTMDQQAAPRSNVNITLSPNISIDSRTDRADVQRIVDGSLRQYHEMSMAQLKELGLV